MIKIAICDDEYYVTKWMEKVIEDHRFRELVSIDTFISGQELHKSATKKRYDIVFIDIELVPGEKDGNGMLISAKIKKMYPEVLIIFFTGTFGYEYSLLNFEPFRFMRKPVKANVLIKVVKDAIDRIKGWEKKYYTFCCDRITMHISLSETILFVSRRPYIEVETLDETMRFRKKMDDVEEEIAKLSFDFIRASKSYLINKAYAKSYTSREVVMENGEHISLGRKYAKIFQERMK